MLHARLIASRELYGGTTEDAARRLFYKKVGKPTRLAYRLVPPPIRRVFEDEFLEYRLRYSVFEEFLQDHPEFINMVSDAMDSVTHEPERVLTTCQKSAQRYQLGILTIRDNEKLILDESFTQRACSILWRDQDDIFSLDQYFTAVPTPETVIYVDAPVEVCIDRQRTRGRMPVSKDWESDGPEVVQKKVREICSSIANHLANETSVLTVENTGTVKKTTSEIKMAISK